MSGELEKREVFGYKVYFPYFVERYTSYEDAVTQATRYIDLFDKDLKIIVTECAEAKDGEIYESVCHTVGGLFYDNGAKNIPDEHGFLLFDEFDEDVPDDRIAFISDKYGEDKARLFFGKKELEKYKAEQERLRCEEQNKKKKLERAIAENYWESSDDAPF